MDTDKFLKEELGTLKKDLRYARIFSTKKERKKLEQRLEGLQ